MINWFKKPEPIRVEVDKLLSEIWNKLHGKDVWCIHNKEIRKATLYSLTQRIDDYSRSPKVRTTLGFRNPLYPINTFVDTFTQDLEEPIFSSREDAEIELLKRLQK